MRVLRIYHSAVVTAWRARDRAMREKGVDLELVSPRSWNEGGASVNTDPGADTFVRTVRTFGRHPYRFLYDPIALLRALRNRPLDLIDVHEEPASLAFAEVRILAWLCGHRHTPMVFYGAQNIPKRYPLPFRRLEQRAFRRAVAAYVCNDDAGRIFRAKGFRGTVRTIGLGVDLEAFAPQGRATSATGLQVGYVGRLEPHKGVHIAVDAVTGSPHRLHVYGAGGADRELQARAERLAAPVTFHGSATQEQLPEIYRSFDAVVVPSQATPSWREQFGRVAVEAMASGVPVLVSDEGSLSEVVGDAGIVLPAAEPARWRAALDELAADPARRADLAARGVERASRYRWPAIAGEHVDLYRTVLQGAS